MAYITQGDFAGEQTLRRAVLEELRKFARKAQGLLVLRFDAWLEASGAGSAIAALASTLVIAELAALQPAWGMAKVL
jgi:hypothetical protein